MNRLGVDLFSLRSQNWTAFQYLEYCATQGVQVVNYSEPRFLGSLEESHLRQVRAAAERLGLAIEIGMSAISPTSNIFDARQGPAEEQLRRMIRAAGILGSSIVRAAVGNRRDRRSSIPMEAHIENALCVLRAVRSAAIDAGIHIAIENHAGDLRACELKTLVEEAGTDFAGVCLDSGNLPLTFDLPLSGLELLAPYVLTSHVRDSRIWRTPTGVAIQWVRAGDGNVGFCDFLRRFVRLLPACPISIETIALKPFALDFHEPGFWSAFPDMRASEFTPYLEIAEQGSQPSLSYDPADGCQECELRNLEASLLYCREVVSAQA